MKYLCRKNRVTGRWQIWMVTEIAYAVTRYDEVANLETYGDALVLFNLRPVSCG